VTEDNVKKIPWPKVATEIEDLSGIPRKQIDEVANQIALGIESIAEKNQPKKDGDAISIETPFAAYEFKRLPASNVQGPDGKTVIRPACVGANTSIPRSFIIKANTGLVDGHGSETTEEKKKAKVG
jgi:hypothetical protein